ncbi:EAL domain-containing protein [Shewanella baltica]|uniref:EAL domain-containing protein n=1 Tax=Shewanella baltica TaxID=62322 RepID=UPI00217CE670|nr:EAL domain-containing protein [Shewanella baltica]MCS6271824.1 EAL domain-containing protein [Shewanella baltica]
MSALARGVEHCSLVNFDLDGFHYHFQPQYSLVDSRLRGYECLLRWSNERSGIVMPDITLPIINSGNLWGDLWPLLLSRIPDFYDQFALNVSPSDLELGEDSIFLRTFYAMVRAGEIDPNRFEIEITEDSPITNFEQVNCAINFLKSLGSKVVLDDFGAGWCNLSYLDLLDVDGIKIDKGIVKDIESSKINQIIVKSIIDIAKHKGCFVLAEGIESSAQLDLVTTMGCDFGQGYFLGRPSPKLIY